MSNVETQVPMTAGQSGRNNWKLDIFYFSRTDKRILPPERTSMLGWTVNWANPMSVLAFAAIVGSLELIWNMV